MKLFLIFILFAFNKILVINMQKQLYQAIELF